jgi:hypothetical protein
MNWATAKADYALLRFRQQPPELRIWALAGLIVRGF